MKVMSSIFDMGIVAFISAEEGGGGGGDLEILKMVDLKA